MYTSCMLVFVSYDLLASNISIGSNVPEEWLACWKRVQKVQNDMPWLNSLSPDS